MLVDRQSVGIIAILSAIVGCTARAEDAPKGPRSVVEQRFARLSHAEWEQTVVDLLELPGPTGLSEKLAADALAGKVFDNDRSTLSVSPPLWGDYRAVSETLAERVSSDQVLLARLLPSASPDAADSVRAFIQSFGAKAYRRPLAPAEIEAHRALFARGATLYPELSPFVAGVRLSISAFLQSPHFLYREDLAPSSEAGDAAPLDAWGIASRLSYAAWQTMPDAELRRAAAAGELSTGSGLHAQVERLLAAPRAVNGAQHFFEQLYQTDQYAHIRKSTEAYPTFTVELSLDMQTEMRKFTSDVYARGGGLEQLLTSTTSFVSPRLAASYGLASELTTPDADGFSRVELDPKQRAGLLTRAGFLAWKSGDSQPNSIQRGVFVLRRILCQPLGNPPPAAQAATLGHESTNRKRVEALTGVGTCAAACHARYINPLGFGLEHFGALGEYRDRDLDEPIDASGSLVESSGELRFGDGVELSRALAQSPEAHACYSGYLLEYLLGRVRDASGQELAQELGRRSLSGVGTRELAMAILESDVFRGRPTVLE